MQMVKNSKALWRGSLLVRMSGEKILTKPALIYRLHVQDMCSEQYMQEVRVHAHVCVWCAVSSTCRR